MYKKNTTPTQEHLDHVAFSKILMGLEDEDGWRILLVEYTEVYPDYEGGIYSEIIDPNGEEMDPVFICDEGGMVLDNKHHPFYIDPTFMCDNLIEDLEEFRHDHVEHEPQHP